MELMTCTLGDICDEVGGVIRTGPFGSQLHESDYKESGVPVIMPKNIVDGRISTEEIARIGERDANRLLHHRLRKCDIVYGRRGDIGRRALITKRENGWLCGTGCIRISLGNSVLDPIFLYYYLGQSDIVSWIYNQAIGATLPNLNTSIIRSIPIRYPPLPTQRKIAAILSAYDDMIENNTRRIKILEEMAQALYREWFVLFRFSGHEKVRMVDSPLGKIPERWELKKASEIIFINPRTKVPKEGPKQFVMMENLSTDSMIIENSKTKIGNAGSKFKNQDTLFARITPCLENGKIGFVQFLASDNDVAVGSTEFIVLRSRTVVPEFVYLMARSQAFRDHAIKSMCGATGRQRVNEACFDNFLIVRPHDEVLQKFHEIVSPIFKLVHLLTGKNVTLRRTRDLLLPKLISGNLNVENMAIKIKNLNS
jgi:type I restriction enzyme S subunit